MQEDNMSLDRKLQERLREQNYMQTMAAQRLFFSLSEEDKKFVTMVSEMADRVADYKFLRASDGQASVADIARDTLSLMYKNLASVATAKGGVLMQYFDSVSADNGVLDIVE